MPKNVQIDATYDLVTKRYKAECPVDDCGRIYVRATSESALWNLSQHVVYDHDLEPVKAGRHGYPIPSTDPAAS